MPYWLSVIVLFAAVLRTIGLAGECATSGDTVGDGEDVG